MEHASPLDQDTLLRHEEFVLRLARTLVRGESDAREVVQRTLVSAIENPPRHSGIRAWLARVTRNHAHELHRGAKRRADRERAVARPEATTIESSAVERLELESDVVRAVLALDEPYRGVIVATYYEELAPSEIAKQRGVPAGTVRSQLTRAHEQLRAKLDSKHGDRANWLRGLTGLLAVRDAPTAATFGTSSLAWPVAIGAGLAACVTIVLVVSASLDPSSSVEIAAVQPTFAQPVQVADTLRSELVEPTREPVEAAANASTAALTGFAPADELVELLERSRQIKKLILDRRLTMTAEERARAGIPTDTATSGVVRVLDRDAFGGRYTLPWLREGGSYYSFTERGHDYNRRPQIGLEQGRLSASFYGASGAILVDLGERRLADVPDSSVAPAWLGAAQQFLWASAHGEFNPAKSSFRDTFAQRLKRARERGGIDKTMEAELSKLSVESVTAHAGHAYLVRAVSQDEHDLVVALEVIAVAADQCTIAYRILESRPIENPRPLSVPTLRADELPPPSPKLRAMSEPELVLALGAVRTRADEVLFLGFSPLIEQRFGGLRARGDSGVTRMVPNASEWSELVATRLGCSHYSFLARSHGGDATDISVQGEGEHAQLCSDAGGDDFGLFVDLGTTSLESLALGAVVASGELGAHFGTDALPTPVELPAGEPARQGAIDATKAAWRSAMLEFKRRADNLGSSNRAPAIVGRTYALRSVRFGSHDILVAVHVAAIDEQGVVIAWKQLKSWPVLQRD